MRGNGGWVVPGRVEKNDQIQRAPKTTRYYTPASPENSSPNSYYPGSGHFRSSIPFVKCEGSRTDNLVRKRGAMSPA